MKYRLYTTSQSAWNGMFAAMAAAQKSIYLEMYTFLDDTQATHDFLKLLQDKARAGLEVVIIADSFGSSSLRPSAAAALRNAGAEFIFFNRWLHRTHRKILIIDNQIAFLGGVNIIEETRHWLDLQIRLQGRIIRPILKSFAYTYEIVGGHKESILRYSRLPLVQKIKAWIVDNWPGTPPRYLISDYYKKKISEARQSISIVTPYLLPPTWLIAALENACQRGVQVEILIPNDTDVKPLNKVNYLNACRLSALGVKFYLMPAMNHAKIMLIDGEEGVVGSQNMDVLSFNWNIEAGIFFRQKNLVNDLRRIIDQWRQGAVAFETSRRRISWSDRILVAVLKLFYPLF
ncbi:MAG: phosphatidylserine/phosphatidylglycerophosphate/cardiolipin synthase family protein [Patescibacteria group bacterium]